jgi:hypothetical protein
VHHRQRLVAQPCVEREYGSQRAPVLDRQLQPVLLVARLQPPHHGEIDQRPEGLDHVVGEVERVLDRVVMHAQRRMETLRREVARDPRPHHGVTVVQHRVADVAVAPAPEALEQPREEVARRLRLEFTAADPIRISVEEAWSSPKTLQPPTLATVEVTADTASATPTRAGEPAPMRLVFHQAPAGWRLDLVTLTRGADAALAATLQFRAERAGVDLDTAIRWAIEGTSGHLVDRDLWAPLAGEVG